MPTCYEAPTGSFVGGELVLAEGNGWQWTSLKPLKWLLGALEKVLNASAFSAAGRPANIPSQPQCQPETHD